MRDFRVTIRLRAPTATPWQSDTIFGHIAWLVAYGRGGHLVDTLPAPSPHASAIAKFLAPFRTGRPLFVLSDAFPAGYLPRPLYPLAPGTLSFSGKPAEAYEQNKSAEKALLVREDTFQHLRRGNLQPWSGPSSTWRPAAVLHASIHRFTETTSGELIEESAEATGPQAGNLFMIPVLAPSTGTDRIHLYLRASAEWGKWVVEMLDQLALIGFGRKRSVGLGAFEVEAFEPYDGFSFFEGADGFISLSTYIPASSDPTSGFWRIRLKYGRLGENAGGGKPFKRPLLQFEPGAVFYTPDPPRPYYGRAIEGIAPGMQEAIQCCFTLSVPCKIPPIFTKESV